MEIGNSLDNWPEAGRQIIQKEGCRVPGQFIPKPITMAAVGEGTEGRMLRIAKNAKPKNQILFGLRGVKRIL